MPRESSGMELIGDCEVSGVLYIVMIRTSSDMRKESKNMMTNINETVASYFEGCVGVGVFDCFVHPSFLA